MRGGLVYGLGLFGSEARQLAGSGAHWPISQTGERLSPINIVFFTFISQLDHDDDSGDSADSVIGIFSQNRRRPVRHYLQKIFNILTQKAGTC